MVSGGCAVSRLVNASRSMEVSHQAAATRYVFERVLVRLGECEVWNKRLVLKGAMALIGVTQDHQRTTTDIDVWAIDKLTREEAIEAFKAIASVTPSDADPMTFNLDTLKVELINTKADEPGHQITCEARIGNMRLKFKLEISHGHVCTPKPVMMTYPTVLDGHAPAKIMAYNAETMLAEKVHAIVSLGTHTSLYKDFYDVALIMKKCDLDGHDTEQAFKRTFGNRLTDIPDLDSEKLPVFHPEFFAEGERNWREWADKKFAGQRGYVKQSYADLVAVIEPFISYCCSMTRDEAMTMDWKAQAWSVPLVDKEILDWQADIAWTIATERRMASGEYVSQRELIERARSAATSVTEEEAPGPAFGM